MRAASNHDPDTVAGGLRGAVPLQDAAGNISKETIHSVEIDTMGSDEGIQVITDPREDDFPLLGIRNYTASEVTKFNWQTNSNWPLYMAICLGCEFASADPQVFWDPAGPEAGWRYCSQLPSISNGTMSCTFNCFIVPESSHACFNVHFDNNPGVGHNGELTVPFGNVFKDFAGNPATGSSTLDIYNEPPVIILK